MSEIDWAPVPPLPPDRRGLVDSIAGWVRSPPLEELVRAFDGELPRDADLGDLLDWLEAFSTRWDYRAGQQRNLVSYPELGPDLEQLVMTVARALGLIGIRPPSSRSYDHVLILGGLVRACFARPLHAARLFSDADGSAAAIAAKSVTALSSYRSLCGDELKLVATFDRGDLTDEFAAMDAGVRAAFDVGEFVDERGEPSQVMGAAWGVRRYQTPDGVPINVIAAPSSEPDKRRANTPDTYAWFAEQHAQLQPDQRILVVTTDIYVPYQHADALRVLGLPYGVEIDAIGILPGDVNARLAQEYLPHSYLQEIRSTIRALRALHDVPGVAC